MAMAMVFVWLTMVNTAYDAARYLPNTPRIVHLATFGLFHRYINVGKFTIHGVSGYEYFFHI